MESVKGLLAPFNLKSNYIKGALVCHGVFLPLLCLGQQIELFFSQKLVAIGGTVETARKVSVFTWNGLWDLFNLTAHVSQEDHPYEWLMHWLSKQPEWARSREFEITTRSVDGGPLNTSTTGGLEELDEEGEHVLEHGRCKSGVTFVPSLDITHTIFYRGHWLKITCVRQDQDSGRNSALKISVVAWNDDIFKRLVLDARRGYEKEVEDRVHIFMADKTYACWRWICARQKRPISSIILEPAVKEMLLQRLPKKVALVYLYLSLRASKFDG